MIGGTIEDLRLRLRWARRLRAVAIFLLIAPVVAFGVVLSLALATQKNPDSGFFVLGLIYFGAMWSPVLLIPMGAWLVLSRRCRSLQERLDCLPTRKLSGNCAPHHRAPDK